MEIEWLDDLETRVRDAVERLGELREENGTLRERVEELETQLATLSIPPAEPMEVVTDDSRVQEELEILRARVRDLEDSLAAAETERAAAAGAAKGWEVEREEVRRRVEGLVGRLEGLAQT
ncbi:MAG TPA: cell division protein ZapB [Thermoanaerobaculia bacterium]